MSAVTWTTLGYGDYSSTQGVRMLAALEAVIGYLYFGIFVAFVIKFVFPQNVYNVSNKSN
ncbi:MAG: two pore domain potassium channel family protein [Thiotrichaceae bacterium]|nr:two pore domain potassium channel family protein [Thiotrichaceae bacterium]